RPRATCGSPAPRPSGTLRTMRPRRPPRAGRSTPSGRMRRTPDASASLDASEARCAAAALEIEFLLILHADAEIVLGPPPRVEVTLKRGDPAVQVAREPDAMREQAALGDVVGAREIHRPARAHLIMRHQVAGLLRRPLRAQSRVSARVRIRERNRPQ